MTKDKIEKVLQKVFNDIVKGLNFYNQTKLQAFRFQILEKKPSTSSEK